MVFTAGRPCRLQGAVQTAARAGGEPTAQEQEPPRLQKRAGLYSAAAGHKLVAGTSSGPRGPVATCGHPDALNRESCLSRRFRTCKIISQRPADAAALTTIWHETAICARVRQASVSGGAGVNARRDSCRDSALYSIKRGDLPAS